MVPEQRNEYLRKFREVFTGFVDHLPFLNIFVKSSLVLSKMCPSSNSVMKCHIFSQCSGRALWSFVVGKMFCSHRTTWKFNACLAEPLIRLYSA